MIVSDKESVNENQKKIVTISHIIGKNRIHLTCQIFHLFNKKDTLEGFENMPLIRQITS